MKDQILARLQKAWAQFLGFTPGQKTVAIAAGLAVVVGGYLFTTWKSSTPYAPLYTNLAPADASAIVDRLNSAGTPYQLGQAGTEILVPQSDVYSSRLTVSAAGLPASSQTGYALLDKEGVTTSQFQQQIDYQRAIEGELDKTIESMSGVQSASVHLAIPQQTVFNDGSQKPTAAVLISTGMGTQLTTTQIQSLVYLVSSSVPNLSANDVTITDADGRLLAAPGDNISTGAGMDTQSQATQTYDQQQQAKIESLLTPLVGSGHAVVTVDAKLNFDKSTTTQNLYVPNPSAPPLSEQVSTETYKGANAAGGGTLGAGTPSASATPAAGGGNYTKKSVTRDNALGTEVKHTETAPGGVVVQHVAVLIDSSVKGVTLSKVQALLNSAAGLQTSRGDTLSLQAMPFDTSAAKAAAAQAAAAQKATAAAAAHARLMSMIKQGVLGAILLAVLIGTWLASRRRRRGAPVVDPDDVGADLFAPVPVPAPVLTPEYPTIAAELQEAAAQRRALVTLAEEQPEDVASVLSGWIASRDIDHVNDNRSKERSSW